MLSRLFIAALVLALSAGATRAAGLTIGAVVAKRVQINLQGNRLEVRSNSREGVVLTLGTTTLVVPGGVQVLDLRELGLAPDVRITASPL